MSWSLDDPREFGSDFYRSVAGLPDKKNAGTFLATATLIDDLGIHPQPAGAIAQGDAAWCDYPGGGIDEILVPLPQFQLATTPTHM